MEKRTKRDAASEESIGPLLEEYKTLRAEILNHQNMTIKLFQFTIVALGGILGVLGLFLRFNSGNLEPDTISKYVLIFSTFGIIVIDASLFYSISIGKQMDVIAAYIRKYIESKIGDLNWETRWEKYRDNELPTITRRMSISIYYLLLALSLTLIGLSGGINLGNIYFRIIFLVSFVFFMAIFLFSLKRSEPKWDNIK